MALTALDALREIQRALDRHQAEDVPEGWMTAEQWADQSRLSRSHAQRILRDGIAIGMVECREFRVPRGGGARAVSHYRAKA